MGESGFSKLTIAEQERFLSLAQSRLKRRTVSPMPILHVDRGRPIPLSFAQQRLWFVAQMEGGSEAYQISFGIRLTGKLDRAALRRALDRIVDRHEVLRTTFMAKDGEPVQRIAPAGENNFCLFENDLRQCLDAQSELEHLIEKDARERFDLERGPLIRGRLICLGEEHALHITMHHIVSDGWSMGLFFKELSTLYAAFVHGQRDPLPDLPVQYADYAVWQRKWMEGEVLKQQAEYWKKNLEGSPELLELPADRLRPARRDFAGAMAQFALSEKLTAALKELSLRQGTTVYMTLLTAWTVLLGRLSGQQDVVMGTLVANRGRAEIENLIGFFVNTLVLRLDLSGRPTVREMLKRVKTHALEVQHYQDMPFEQVVELVRPERNLAYTPLFQVLFAWQNAPVESLELPGLVVSPLQTSPHGSKFDLSLSMEEAGERITGAAEYATSLYEKPTIERYFGYLQRVLEGMVRDEQAMIDCLPILSEEERNEVVYEWNRTAMEFPRSKYVHELFEEHVARNPEAVAVVHDGAMLSYGELNRRANRLAHYLRRLGVKPEDRVGIFSEGGWEMMVALLAVLKAGGAYVPLDPSHPSARLQYMLEDSRAGVLLTQRQLQNQMGWLPAALQVVDLGESARWAGEREDNPEPGSVGLGPEQLAYVMYTSGSTGQPKGVMVTHRSIVRLVCNTDYVELGVEDVVAQASNASFDAATFEIWGALLTGGRLVHVGKNELLTPARLGEVLQENRVTTLFLTTALFNQVAREEVEALNGLRYVLFGGEQVEWRWVKQALEGAGIEHLLHVYGPTETVTYATWHEVRGVGEGENVPIGKPLANTRMYVLDGNGEPVARGVKGELYIGGAGVGRGYMESGEMTAERFVPDPYAGEEGARMYRTGDIGKWRGDGAIEYCGRRDDQVKIRGYRIELGEIEARLREWEGIEEVVVVAREDVAGEKRLVAYYTAKESAETEPGKVSIGADELRNYLGEHLPEYKVPAAYVLLERLPLAANGKVDRNALPVPEDDACVMHRYVAPEGQVETEIARIWSEVLKVEEVGRHDNFFALGGRSLLAVRVVARVRQVMDVELTTRDVFEHSTLSSLAEQIINLKLNAFNSGDLLQLLKETQP